VEHDVVIRLRNDGSSWAQPLFNEAVDEIERLRAALAEIERLRLATDEGTLAKRADRMWEIACEALGKPIPGVRPFLSN
jgi:hypothetical protein